MEIHTYWWGVEMFPDTDEEWAAMKLLATDPTVLGTYDTGDEPITLWDMAVDPREKTVDYPNGSSYAYDLWPRTLRDGKTNKTRCMTISR